MGTMTPAEEETTTVAENKSRAKGEYKPKCFTAHEFQTLRRLSDLIIPADDHSPGALEAGAAEWIDYMASNSTELAQIFTGGFGWVGHYIQRLHNAEFFHAQPTDPIAALGLISVPEKKKPP